MKTLRCMQSSVLWEQPLGIALGSTEKNPSPFLNRKITPPSGSHPHWNILFQSQWPQWRMLSSELYFPKQSDQVNISCAPERSHKHSLRVVSALPWQQSWGPVYTPEQEPFVQFGPPHSPQRPLTALVTRVKAQWCSVLEGSGDNVSPFKMFP